jgi:hypothetical protein
VTNIYDRPRPPPLNGALMPPMASSSDQLTSLLKAPPCPRCNAPMWLTRMEPHPTPNGGVDDMIYECACGEQVVRTLPSP